MLLLAAPDPVVMVARVIGEDTEALSDVELESAAQRVASYLPTLAVIERASFLRDHGALDRALRGCGAEGQCIAECLKEGQIRYGLFVLLNPTVNPPLLALQLFEAGHAQPKALAAHSLPIPKRHQLAEIERQMGLLWRSAGYLAQGLLLVESEPAGATVFVGPHQAPTPARLFLPAGEHALRILYPEHTETASVVRVVAAQDQHLRLVLAPESSLLRSPWLWIGVGVAAAAAVGLMLFLPDPAPIYCTGRDPAQCP